MESSPNLLVDEYTKKHVASLKSFNDEDFKTICQASMCYLIDNNKLEKLNKLNETLAEIKNCKEITKWLIKSLIPFLKQKSSESVVFKEYISVGLDENKANILRDLWEKHQKQLLESLENQQSFMSSQLVDMEWKFGVTASTNQIDKIGNPFLQLKLVLNVSGNLETHYMEMTLQKFYSFLHEMNKAKSQMDYLN